MKIIQKNEISAPKCNCHKYPCPLKGNCQIKNVIYQATVKSENDEKTYVGLTGTTFKARWSNHKTGFVHRTEVDINGCFYFTLDGAFECPKITKNKSSNI